MFIIAAAETEKKTRTIKSTVQPGGDIRHPRTLMGILGVNTSIKMSGLVIRFQYEENDSMLAETLGEYSLESMEAAYEYPW